MSRSWLWPSSFLGPSSWTLWDTSSLCFCTMSSLGMCSPTNAKQSFCHCHGSWKHSSCAFLRAGSMHSFTRCLLVPTCAAPHSTGMQMNQQPWTLPHGAYLLTTDTLHLLLSAYCVLDTELSTSPPSPAPPGNLYHPFQEMGFSYHHFTHEGPEAQRW